MKFTEGDHVTLTDTPSTRATGWEGLTATVVRETPSGILIRLDDGLERPDGMNTPDRQFVWPEEFLEKRDDTENKDDPETETERLEAQVAQYRRMAEESQRELNDARIKHEEFRERVVDVAARYAEENDWCSVVMNALEEMGLPTTREIEVQITGRARITVPVCGDLSDGVSSVSVDCETGDTAYLEDVEVIRSYYY